MPDRKNLVSTPWLASSLVLLASALFASIGTSRFAADSSRPDCPRLAFAPPPGQPTTFLGAATAIDAVQQVNALASENEEQDRADAWDEPRISRLIPWSFRNLPDRQSIAPRSILSLYPLRC